MFKKGFLTAVATVLCAVNAQAIELNAESYYFVEPETGTVILEKNADKQMGPASLTKLMTTYLLFEALELSELTLDSEIKISEKAWRKGGSKMFLEVGKTVGVEDLIKGIVVASGNDACIVASEFLGGTEDAFAEMMNEKAIALKMFNTTFKNSSGWPNPEQVSTAKDMTLLARALIKNFQQYYHYFGIKRFTYNDISQPNRNGLLNRNVGVDGMKTGHIEDAGYHLVSSAERKNIRLVSVVMGAKNMKSREDETLTGLSYAFRTHGMVEAVRKGTVVDDKAPTWMGVKEHITLKAGEDVSLYVANKDKKKIKSEVIYQAPLQAPISLNQQVGILRIVNPTSGTQMDIPLLAAESVDEAGFTSKAWRYILHAAGL
ncbi:MAG: D-alanyl-D-alanine carboxypeptidase (penicillin-binding protein 5/6) [Alphaproteobacteria bacterium]